MLTRIWMILPAISLVALAQQDNRAHGPWKLGMSRDEVKAVKDNGPYKPVRVTGGIETANGIFDGERRNVAFVFAENGTVNKIQVWAYEGSSEKDALKNWYRVYQYYTKLYGTVESPTLGFPPAVDEHEFLKRSRELLGSAPIGTPAKMQMAPRPMPPDAKVFATFFRTPVGYTIFVNIMEH